MATKLSKGQFPSGCCPDDFECFGPPATQDGEFDAVKIADMGCFKQGGVDSNKYYHGAVVQHTGTKAWYAYFEWGRVGATNPDFQFVQCGSESEAQIEFSKQLMKKNVKRGMWVTVAGIKTLDAKPNKDCYLVRPQATRSTGLPDAKKIRSNDAAPKKTTKKKTTKRSKTPSADAETISLMRDLNVATVKYAKGQMADSSIPTQTSIEEARQILTEAQQRLVSVGGNLDSQIQDGQMRKYSSLLYSRIPKVKRVGAPDSEWILSQDNILMWQQDLDAFESALASEETIIECTDDPFGDMRITMRHVDRESKEGKLIYKWMPKASRNRHGGVGSMNIKNVWIVERHGVSANFNKVIDGIVGRKRSIIERPERQPISRTDLSAKDRVRFESANVGLLFHGTRSVNVSGILREGLRLPKQLVGVALTGAMFGPGHYWADDWKKSAGYCSIGSSYWARGAGKVSGRQAFMFVADVALGKAHVAPGCHGYKSPPAGADCVFGKAGASGVMNNEWVTFNNHQNQLRYLVEFSA